MLFSNIYFVFGVHCYPLFHSDMHNFKLYKVPLSFTKACSAAGVDSFSRIKSKVDQEDLSIIYLLLSSK